MGGGGKKATFTRPNSLHFWRERGRAVNKAKLFQIYRKLYLLSFFISWLFQSFTVLPPPRPQYHIIFSAYLIFLSRGTEKAFLLLTSLTKQTFLKRENIINKLFQVLFRCFRTALCYCYLWTIPGLVFHLRQTQHTWWRRVGFSTGITKLFYHFIYFSTKAALQFYMLDELILFGV